MREYLRCLGRTAGLLALTGLTAGCPKQEAQETTPALSPREIAQQEYMESQMPVVATVIDMKYLDKTQHSRTFRGIFKTTSIPDSGLILICQRENMAPGVFCLDVLDGKTAPKEALYELLKATGAKKISFPRGNIAGISRSLGHGWKYPIIAENYDETWFTEGTSIGSKRADRITPLISENKPSD